MMGLVPIGMGVRTEVLAGNAHVGNGDLPLQLQGVNELDKGGQETDLLLRRKLLSRSSQDLRPPIHHSARFGPFGSQMNHHDAVVGLSTETAHKPLLFKRPDDLRGGGQLDRQSSSNR